MALFRPPMLAHAIEQSELGALDPADYIAGMEMGRYSCASRPQGAATEEGNSRAPLLTQEAKTFQQHFPDLLQALRLPAALDGELLIMRDGRVQSFNVLPAAAQPKDASIPTLLADFPAHLRASIFSLEGERRFARLAFLPNGESGWKSSSPNGQLAHSLLQPCPFATWDELAAARADPARAGAGADARRG